MDKIMLSTTRVWPMITAEVLMWVKCINHQMLATLKARNLWCSDLPKEIFHHIIGMQSKMEFLHLECQGLHGKVHSKRVFVA